MTLSIYHGNEEWILKGFGVDIEKSLNKVQPDFKVFRYESFTDVIGDSDFHFFVQQGQLKSFVKKNGLSYLSRSICIFTHFDLNQFPVSELNKCLAVFFMSSSQLSIAVSNGLKPDRCFVVPLGVDQELHTLINPEKIRKIQSSSRQFGNICGRNAIGFCLRYWDKPAYTRRKRYQLIMRIVSILVEDLDLPVIILGPGWKDCKFRVIHPNVIYADVKYKDYPLIYNMMRVFCSFSIHEGGPMPLLESLSCGVSPVVTNTGFAFDVLGQIRDHRILPVNSMIDQYIHAILNQYNSNIDGKKNRSVASPYTFDCAARKILKVIEGA